MLSARLAALAAVSALLLAGCAGPGTSAASPTAPAPEPESPAPTAEPGLHLHPDGLGTLRLGEPVGDDDTFVRYDPGGCADLGIAEGDPYGGFWRAAEDGQTSADGYEILPYWIVTAGGLRDGAVEYVSMGDASITTEAGIALGDPIEDVLAAYPGIERVVDGWASDVYAIEGDVGRLTIEVTKETILDGVSYWEPGDVGTVLVLAATTFPATDLAGGDGGGPCPL